MVGETFDQKPILIIGPDINMGKIPTFVRASGATFSSADIVELSVIEDIRKKLNEPHTQFGLIFLEIEQVDVQWMGLLREFHKDPFIGIPIVITDSREVIVAAREIDQHYFLPASNLTAHALVDVAYAAVANHLLKTENNQLEDRYRSSEKRFKDVADQFSDWLWEIDLDLNLLFSSSRKRPAQGAEAGMKFSSCFLPEEHVRVEDDFAELVRNPKPFQDRDYWSFDPYGTRVCWAVSGVPVFDDNGNLKGFRGIAKDVSVEKASADQLYHLSNNDVVTGIYNRQRFYDEIVRTVRQAGRDKREGALVIIDIDRFAYFNECYGHDIGDKLLVHVAQILRDNIRTGDFLARTAGDEFSIILPDVRADDVTYRVHNMLDALKTRQLITDKGPLSFNVSMAVVRFPMHGKSADEVLTHANVCLHKAKDLGRNRIEYYEEGTNTIHPGKKHLEALDFMTECLSDEKERLVLHYQPIISLNGKGHQEFYEVLVRMLDQEGNLIAPLQFIETAEEFGMIGKIDRIVSMRSISKLKEWRDNGRNVRLSINISAKTFEDEVYLKDVSELLKKVDLPKGSVVFEITETALLRDMTQVRKFMEAMREYGAGFALDDCGVGYSSFNYIRHLDLDYIKIDGTFVRNLHRDNSDDEAFVKALNDIAKKKQIPTVAEMVENSEVVEKLKKIGIDYAQGFYFAMPEPELPDPKDKKIH